MRIFKYTIASAIMALLAPVYVYAQGFVPVSPIPSVSTASTDVYLENIFVLLISVATILAVIKLMICGIQYMASESISTKTSAKTCISYVIGGLFLILLSFLILQTINEDLVSGSFDSITEPIRDRLSGISYDEFTPLDGGDLDADDLPADLPYYEITFNNTCPGGGEVTFSQKSLFNCEETREGTLNASLYSVRSSCQENDAGDFCFTVSSSGYKCPREVLPEECYPSSWNPFDWDDNCEDALDDYLDIKQYTLVRDCTEVEP